MYLTTFIRNMTATTIHCRVCKFSCIIHHGQWFFEAEKNSLGHLQDFQYIGIYVVKVDFVRPAID